MPDVSPRILDLLRQSHYHLAVGNTTHHPYPIARTTLIASKYEGKEFPFSLPGNAGGGAIGFEIPELNTIVLAPHPSAFSNRIRAEQLAHVKKTVQSLLAEKPKQEILVVGDFNADSDEIDSFINGLPLTRFSHPSFPSDRIYKQLNKRKWRWIKPLMGLSNGQRSIDHVLATSGWKNPKIKPYQTSSDHVALILDFGE